MGQHTSRDHAPLTFGYVNHASEDNEDMIESLDHFGNQKDFVLANPHLYQLQSICDECNTMKAVNEVVVSLTGESCSKCQKQKRLSLVRKDLAEDLEYIDQTYYPDLVHYNNHGSTTEQDPLEKELLQFDGDTEDGSQQWSRLTIGEVTPGGTKRRPRRLTGPSMAVDLSARSLVKLSPSIGYLDSLTKLNLANNQMTSLPRELGYLKNLRVLNISNNAIDEIPDTIAFLTKLKALNVAHNKLVQLPSSIGQLPKLVIIIANNNDLTSLPREFSHLVNLISLNVSSNPLRSLPAEIAALSSLRKLITEDCAFEEEYTYGLTHDPPSLFETCARIAVRSQTNIPNQLADHIKDYISRADTCSYCRGPFFDSFVTRARFIERRAGHPMALEYTLCCAHWTNEKDRLLAMFSQQPTSTKGNRIDMDGLNDAPTATANTNTISSRHRAYSDTSNSFYRPPTISTPSPLSRRSNSNASECPPPNGLAADYFSLTTPISTLLKNQPDLPALPTTEEPTSYLSPPSPSSLSLQRNRPRAASAASVTKRLTSFIRSNSTASTHRSRSASNSSTTSSLRYEAVTSSSSNTTTGLRDWADTIPVAAAMAAATAAATAAASAETIPTHDQFIHVLKTHHQQQQQQQQHPHRHFATELATET
ncbi:hypothetical protein [Parasitella parasitica]|uniref:Disease resistance R13L4/SHOC-2-like LRR domain-containing protein n=1 Tax=Parasitella parasitica TaxID=35722 RepID=A0A0B7NS12_9FUNG|nr:hypothetical protein [Parasitella parasitica]